MIYIASLNYHQIICNLLVFHKKLIHKLLISGLPAIPSDHLPFFGSSFLIPDRLFFFRIVFLIPDRLFFFRIVFLIPAFSP